MTLSLLVWLHDIVTVGGVTARAVDL